MSEHQHYEVRFQRAIDAILEARDYVRSCEAPDQSITLGDLIKRERDAWGLSLQDVADRAGMSKAHIWDLECSRALNPTVEALSRISEALRLAPVKAFAAALESRRLLSPPDKGEGR